ncbi:hypothetical protein K439DRAFT_1624194 [Ramaria rubella]|nr:hypothetical protein K439DRAFT_1624194 [Ramaria rubella]
MWLDSNVKFTIKQLLTYFYIIEDIDELESDDGDEVPEEMVEDDMDLDLENIDKTKQRCKETIESRKSHKSTTVKVLKQKKAKHDAEALSNVPKSKKKKIISKINKQGKKTVDSGSSGEEDKMDVEEITANKPGREGDRADWAFAQWTPNPGHDAQGDFHEGSPFNHSAIWNSPRTKGCKRYEDETLARPPSSNFISHLDGFKVMMGKAIVQDQERAVYLQGKALQLSMRCFEGLHNGGWSTQLIKSLSGVPSGKGITAQHEMLRGFTQWGMEHPAHKVTKQGWCTEIWTFYVAHQSKLAIASDLWTSKSSVYAFARCVGFWINDKCNIVEHVLELLELDGDHTGAPTGKLVFTMLHAQGASKKLIGTDNASSNNVMNRAISKGVCIAHVHLPLKRILVNSHHQFRAIFHHLGLISSEDDNDAYTEMRRNSLVYDLDDDPDVSEEMHLQKEESTSEVQGCLADVIEDNSDESDGDCDKSEDEDSRGPGCTMVSSGGKKTKMKKVLSVPEKSALDPCITLSVML